MNHLENLLKQYKDNKVSLTEVMDELKSLPYKDMDFAKIDHHRALRQGFPEVIFCPGKEKDQIVEILKELKKKNSLVIATRADKETGEYALDKLPQAIYHKRAKIISYGDFPTTKTKNYALVISAGTADLPVAEEALLMLKATGTTAETIFDCGVSGVHRFFDHIDKIMNASAIIVVAGMEGALPSVIGGLASCPVIAVPTSIGYGASFGGIAALLGMLNSCVANVSVVNIDNGFGAAHIASIIIKQSDE